MYDSVQTIESQCSHFGQAMHQSFHGEDFKAFEIEIGNVCSWIFVQVLADNFKYSSSKSSK